MKVRVRLFGALREEAGEEGLELELPEGALAGDVRAALSELASETRAVVWASHCCGTTWPSSLTSSPHRKSGAVTTKSLAVVAACHKLVGL